MQGFAAFAVGGDDEHGIISRNCSGNLSEFSRVDSSGYSAWNAPGALDHIEWFQGIRTVTTAGSDYYIQESLHPDYLAQLALRNCVRQAYGSSLAHATCSISATGTDSLGEPNMSLH